MVAVQTHYTVRYMQRDDIPQVSAIDREAFPTQWPPPPFKRDLDSRLVRYVVALDETSAAPLQATPAEDAARGGLHKLISMIRPLLGKETLPQHNTAAPDQGNVVGYAAIWMMVDEAHLTSIAVRESHRRQGAGEMLLIAIIDVAMRLKAQVVTLETRVSNLPAQKLYEKYGFAKVGMRRHYYTDDGEDALVMTTDSIMSPRFKARFDELRQAHFEKMGR